MVQLNYVALDRISERDPLRQQCVQTTRLRSERDREERRDLRRVAAKEPCRRWTLAAKIGPHHSSLACRRPGTYDSAQPRFCALDEKGRPSSQGSPTCQRGETSHRARRCASSGQRLWI